MFIKDEIKNFEKKRPKSKEIWKLALKTLPGGVSHNIRTFGLPSIGGFPVFINSSQGSHLTDIDGNEYLDCWNGHFAMILGHNHPEIQETIKQSLEYGWHFGTNTEHQVKLAEEIIKGNPSLEKMRFCVTGTEATMYASRLARAFTKRRLIAKARLGWHGANDTLTYDVGSLFEHYHPPGLVEADKAGIISFEINNEDTFDMIKQNKDELAAVILEPVLGGGGGYPVDPEFLKRLRVVTEQYNIVLIFDEIITGYRFTNSLFQNELKILPDLTTMGKIIGGGMPIGAIGGRKDIIDKANPESENTVLIGGGTFSGYPLSMIAGLKTLEILKNSHNEYNRINKEGENMLYNLNQFFDEEQLSIVAKGYKSLIMLHAMSNYDEKPSMRKISQFKDTKKEALLQLALFNREISGLHGLGSLSMAHTEKDLARIQEVVKEIAKPVSQSAFN
ncbi:MAG: aspartate aminotransferase family protein [Promethearchaeota archaeon]